MAQRILSYLRDVAIRAILANASALMGTTVITAGLGFVYWWLAARLFVPDSVGFASASIAAMTLLGTVATLGLGTLLIGELPRQPKQVGELITTALVLSTLVGTLLGLLFALLVPLVSAEFGPLTQSFGAVALFASGVGLTTLTLVLDQAMIGLLRGELQLWRNGIFSVAKLLALLGASLWQAHGGLTIYATWAGGQVVSLLCIVALLAWRGVRLRLRWPHWSVLHQMSMATMGYHLLNLALQISGLGMPLVVTVLLSVSLNASFYMAWLLLTLVFAVPYSLTLVLFAAGAAEPDALPAKVRFTLSAAFAAGVVSNLVIWLGADLILGLFGASYREAAWALRLMGLGVFALIVKDHFVAIRRVQGQIVSTGLLITAAGVAELICAGFGARVGALNGLALGWLIALSIEAALLVRTVLAVATSRRRETAPPQTLPAPSTRLSTGEPPA